MGYGMIRARAQIITEKHGKILGIIEIILYVLLGFSAGYIMDKHSIELQCDRHVIDTYYTQEMQNCLLQATGTGVFSVPFGSINISDEEYTKTPGYRAK